MTGSRSLFWKKLSKTSDEPFSGRLPSPRASNFSLSESAVELAMAIRSAFFGSSLGTTV